MESRGGGRTHTGNGHHICKRVAGEDQLRNKWKTKAPKSQDVRRQWGSHVFRGQGLEAVPDFGMAITGGYLVILARLRDCSLVIGREPLNQAVTTWTMLQPLPTGVTSTFTAIRSFISST